MGKQAIGLTNTKIILHYLEDIPGGPRKVFLEDVNETLLDISSRKIKSIFWWAPASDCGRDYFDEIAMYCR